MRSARRHCDVGDEHRVESRFESIESVHARGRAGAGSKRLDETNRLVVMRDHMVAGVAGGDHKTAAAFGGDEQVDESEPNRCNRKRSEERRVGKECRL